jgi:hypothetical protein
MQALIILATLMLTNSFMKEVVPIFTAMKRVVGRYFLHGLEIENNLPYIFFRKKSMNKLRATKNQLCFSVAANADVL